MKRILCVVSLLMLYFNTSFAQQKSMLKLKGEVIGAETKSILLAKPTQSLLEGPVIEIPVKNGKFYYESHLEFPEAVELSFSEIREKGSGSFMELFLENEEIQVTLYNEEEFNKNIVKGGKWNAEYKKYTDNLNRKFAHLFQPITDSLEILYKNDLYDSQEAKELYKQLDEKTGVEKKLIYEKLEALREADKHLSPEAKKLNDRLKPLIEQAKAYRQNYIEENPNLVAYSFLLKDLMYKREEMDITYSKRVAEKLAKANPKHPYNKLVAELVSSLENIQVGQKFVDFTAPDLDGKQVQLSKVIEGKITLLDFWATWCGSCIASTRMMIPIYEAYKDKGFTMVGIAGEFKNTDRLTQFLEKEKWDWLQLVELDRQNKIWQKYGIQNRGGGVFLIDEKGIIIAIDPTAEEVKKELEKRLGKSN
ncbi:redoxin domain-containing protein [Capnocytophaga stomatis]|uniref:Redoxin domain-containing protein n=1 Tax=Capnocytophaga stomatis TaxID=1848904 RepID=A0ABW8QBR9_9FLAO